MPPRIMSPAEPPPAAGAAALYRLMAWLSPGFPVGGYTYSHGIEYAVEAGLVADAASLQAWISEILCRGAGLIDAAIIRATWAAVRDRDDEALPAVAERAAAWRSTAETALESEAQGAAFLAAVAAGWPEPRRDAAVARLAEAGIAPAYAVAVGFAGACADIPLDALVRAYLQAFAASLVSAGVRLVPLGQSEGVRIVAALEDAVARTALLAARTGPRDLGTSAWMTEWASVHHERQYTRLFRS
jgi:urease accessory protein